MSQRDSADTVGRIVYSAGGGPSPGDPGGGRFELAVAADGQGRLAHSDGRNEREWTAAVDPLVWQRILDGLRAAGFPQAPAMPLPPGGRPRHLSVTGIAEAGRQTFGWNNVEFTAMGPVFVILDSLVQQVSGGAVTMTVNRLPTMVHRRQSPPPATQRRHPGTPHAAFGAAGGAPAYALALPAQGWSAYSLPGNEQRGGSQETRTVDALTMGATADQEFVVTADGRQRLITWTSGVERDHVQRAPHRGGINAVAMGAPGPKAMVFAATADGVLSAWYAANGQERGGIPTGDGPLTAVCALRHGRQELVAFGGESDRVRVAKVVDGSVRHTLTGHGGWVNDIAYDETTGLLAVAGADHAVRVWDLADGELRQTLTGPAAGVRYLTFCRLADRTVLTGCALDATITSWDAVTGERVRSWTLGEGWPTGVGTAYPGGRPVIVTAGTDGAIQVWDAATGQAVRAWTVDSAPTALAAAQVADVAVVATGHADGVVRLWNAADGSQLHSTPAGDGTVTSLAFGTAGTTATVVAGTSTGTVREHDVATGQEFMSPTPHTDTVYAMNVTHHGELLVTAGADGVVRTWRSRYLLPLRRLLGHTGGVSALASMQVGELTMIASAGYDRTVRVWDGVTGALLGTLRGHSYPVYAVEFGTIAGQPVLASGSYDGVVRVWDLRSGEQIAALSGIDGMVSTLTFAVIGDDVTLLYVGSADGSLRGFHVPSGMPVLNIKLPAAPLAVKWESPLMTYAVTAQGLALLASTGTGLESSPATPPPMAL